VVSTTIIDEIIAMPFLTISFLIPINGHFTRHKRKDLLLQLHGFVCLAYRKIEQLLNAGQTFILHIVCRLGCFVMMQEKGVIGIGEDDILPQKRVFDKCVISIDLFKDIIIAVDEYKSIFALTARFVVKVERVLGNKNVIIAQLVDQLTDILQLVLCNFLLLLNFIDCQLQLGNRSVVKREGFVYIEKMTTILQSLLYFAGYF